MDAVMQNQIELSAILDAFEYLDINVEPGSTLKQIIDTIGNEKNEFGKTVKDTAEYQEIEKAIQSHPEWGKVKLIDQSSGGNSSRQWTDADGSAQWTDDLIQASTFVDADGNYYISYRGTGEGRWADNGDGMSEPSTQMQEAAAAYYDYIAENYLLDAHAQGKEIIVTGHSKGGNEAQYVMLASKYEYLIDHCYSLDGQGFSPKAIQNFISRYGEEYYREKLSDMYSICGDNDFVHGLGEVIIPPENTYYVHTQFTGPLALHHITYIIGTLSGNEHLDSYDGLHWFRDENGNIIHGEPGPICGLIDRLSKNMMKMDEDDRNGAALVMMVLVDYFLSDNKSDWSMIGDIDIGALDIVDFFAHGVPVLLKTVFFSPEGLKAVGKIGGELLVSLYNGTLIKGVKGIPALLGAALGSALILAIAGKLLLRTLEVAAIIVIAAKVIDFIADTAAKIADLAKKVKDTFDRIKEAVIKTIGKFAEKLKSISAGGRYAAEHPKISVDPFRLRDYGIRLSNVNRRIVSLDGRMDRLYKKIGLRDLYSLLNLLAADLGTGYSYKLSLCENYLNNTADDFDSVEKELTSKL